MTAIAPPPLSLTILRQGERLFVDLAEMGTLIPRGETRVEDAFLREVAAQLRLLVTPGFGHAGSSTESALSAGHHRLQRLGSVIFSHLLPESAQNRLRAAAPGDLYLRLDEQLLAVPWELAYDGQDFLATKFRVGRQVITSQPLPGAGTARAADGLLKVLLIADPTESLPQAAAEVEQLCALLEEVAGVEVTLLGGKNVRKLALLAAVQEHAVVHFAGHSVYDPRSRGESGWRLHEGLLTARELGKLTQPPQLIFSNSCQAGATTEWASRPQDRDQGFGLGSTFLLAGVPNYIGPCWVVQDGESVEFATAFYRQLATGQSLGVGLREARQAGMATGGRENLTWASYVLYGDPTATLLPAAAQPEGLRSSSSERSVRRGAQTQRTPRRPRTTPNPRKAPRSARPAPMDPAPTPPAAERRQLTVLFGDLVDFTALSTRLDPEELREMVHVYHETCAAVIRRYDGYIAQYLGNGLLVYFGYPAAHEDAAQRAVRAGLGIVEAIQSLRPKLAHPMRIRVGIHTGLVVVGEVGVGTKQEQLAVGEAPNTTARLQGVAAPDTVVMSEATARLVADLFVCQHLGPQSLKGLPAAVEAYQVLKESEDQGRFAVAVKRGLTPLVGREVELGLLRERWARASEGQGQVVLLSGEPGIGKSRLAHELKEQVAHEGATRIEFRCSPYYQNTALYPILEHLQRLLQFQRETPPHTKLDKLIKALSSYRFPQADTVPLLAHQLRYATSFYGLIDLLAVLPTYLAFFWPDAQLLIDVRVLRLLRVFRVFRLTEYMLEFSQLGAALHASRRKILVFLSFVLMVVLVMGTVMHVIEGPEHGFTSIPVSVYWAITTMTTVGFGDIAPTTGLGRFIASLMMLLGWGVLAVPTGIVTAEMTAQRRPAAARQAALRCAACQARRHTEGARFCWRCGSSLESTGRAVDRGG